MRNLDEIIQSIDSLPEPLDSGVKERGFLAAMWFPDLSGYYAGPTMNYSLAENLDFSLIWQHFYAIMNGDDSKVNMAFLRLKFSF